MTSTSLASFDLSETYSSNGARKFVPGALSAGWPKFRRTAISTRMRAASAFASRVLTRSAGLGSGLPRAGRSGFGSLIFWRVASRSGLTTLSSKRTRCACCRPRSEIGAGMREQTKDQGNLKRLAGEFAKRLMKIGDRKFFIVKIGPRLWCQPRADGLIAAVLKESRSQRDRGPRSDARFFLANLLWRAPRSRFERRRFPEVNGSRSIPNNRRQSNPSTPAPKNIILRIEQQAIGVACTGNQAVLPEDLVEETGPVKNRSDLVPRPVPRATDRRAGP